MRVLVMGAGAIGSLLGHRLATAGHAVTLVARAPWVTAVRTRGLGLQEEGQIRFASNLAAVTDARAVTGQAFDLVVCTTKAYDTVEALRQVAPLVIGGAPLLILQNGVGGEELALSTLPHAQCLSAVITLVVESLSPGLIRLTTTRGGIGLAAVSPGATVDELAAVLRRAGFGRVETYADYGAIKWSKLLLNILGNALPTVLDTPPGALYVRRSLFELERAAFREALTVVRHLGLRPAPLPGYPVPLLAWGMAQLPAAILHPLFRRLIVGGRGGKMPSLHLDLLRGKTRSEVDFLNGAVVEYARDLGLRAPVNEALQSALKAIVSGEIPWAEFRGQPQKLLAKAGRRARDWRC
jgi:2-dehydropantoate 2-reductase